MKLLKLLLNTINTALTGESEIEITVGHNHLLSGNYFSITGCPLAEAIKADPRFGKHARVKVEYDSVFINDTFYTIEGGGDLKYWKNLINKANEGTPTSVTVTLHRDYNRATVKTAHFVSSI